MIIRCRMNRLNQFAPLLAANIRAARQNPKLLGMLRGLDEILFTGLTLPREDEAWAYSQGLPLKVRSSLNFEMILYLLSICVQEFVW
jgi:hypothetical protein